MAEQGAPEADPEEGWRLVAHPLPDEGRTVSVDVSGRRVLLCQVEGQTYAVEDQCPHVRIPLAGGRLDGFLLECPLHGGKLDVRDGSAAGLPIRRPAAVFPLRQTPSGLEIQLR